MEQHQKTLRVGLISPLEELDPRSVGEILTETACRQIFETPYQVKNRQGHVKPWLFATPFAPVQGGAGDEIQAIVRPDVLFSDGTPMTAEIVAACLRADPHFSHLAIRAQGERLRVEGASTMREMEMSLCNTRAAVWKSTADGLVGTGPFQVVRQTDPGVVELAPNPHYPRNLGLDRIRFEVFAPDVEGRPSGLIAALRDDRIDLTFDLSQTEAAPLTELVCTSTPCLSTALLFFNTARPPFDQQDLRLAAAKMLDRSQLSKLFHDRPFAFVATSLLPPELGRHWDKLGRDESEATALAASCRRLDRPLELLLVWGPRPYLPNPKVAARWVREQLAPLDLRIVIKDSISSADFDSKAASGDYDLVLAGWMLESLDAHRYLESILSSRLIPTAGGPLGHRFNVGRLESAEMDAALERYRVQSTDLALTDVLTLSSSLMPAFPLLHGANVVVHSQRVQGVSVGPGGIPMLSDVRLAPPVLQPTLTGRRAVS